MMSLLVAIVSILGDILGSFILKAADVKNSSTLLHIPGYGGVLDICDKIVLCIAIIFYYAKWLGL